MGISKKDFSSVRHSKALYALAIYGFIIMFALMVYPFMPVYKGYSAFQVGSVVFDGVFEENLIVTLTMLAHSLILFFAFIVMLIKIGRYQAGAGYCMYKYFRNWLIILFLLFTGLYYSGYFSIYLENYGFEYWLIVAGAYALGVIFAFLARLVNKPLRPSPLKSFYYFTNIVMCWLFILFFTYAKKNVYYTVVNPEYGYVGDYIDRLDYSLIDLGRLIYGYVINFLLFKFWVCFLHACMPVNAPLAYMSSNATRSRYGKISLAGAVLDLLIVLGLMIAFGVLGLVNEILVMLVPLIFVFIKFWQINGYNRRVKNKKLDTRIPCSTVAYGKVNYKKKGFYYTDYKNASKPDMEVLPFIPKVTPTAVQVEEIKNEEPKFFFDPLRAWDVEQLLSYNQQLDFKDKTTINKMGEDLHAMFNDHGILIEKNLTQKVLAGILSSKVTFIRCTPDRELIKTFSDTISEFFAEEMFYDERLNPEYDDFKVRQSLEVVENSANKTMVVQEEQVVFTSEALDGSVAELKKETAETVVEEVKEDSTEISTEEVVEQVAVPTEEMAEEQSVTTNEEIKEEQAVSQPTLQPLVKQFEKVAPVKNESENEKKVRLKKEEQALIKKERHSMACGMFVAHYIFNTYGMIFLNNSEQMSLSDSDAEVISAIVFGKENVYVGNQKYCPQNEVYSRGVMKVPDNVRLVVFINDHEQTKLDREWLKYSTVVELTLKENQQATRQMQVDCGTSYTMINQSLEEAQETCFLTEDYWRKLDKLEEYLEANTDLRFDNKYLRQIEKSIAAFIACGMDKKQALDAVLSEKIIPLVATEREKILAVQNKDLGIELDELFGFENIPFTKQALVDFDLKK